MRTSRWWYVGGGMHALAASRATAGQRLMLHPPRLLQWGNPADVEEHKLRCSIIPSGEKQPTPASYPRPVASDTAPESGASHAHGQPSAATSFATNGDDHDGARGDFGADASPATARAPDSTAASPASADRTTRAVRPAAEEPPRASAAHSPAAEPTATAAAVGALSTPPAAPSDEWPSRASQRSVPSKPATRADEPPLSPLSAVAPTTGVHRRTVPSPSVTAETRPVAGGSGYRGPAATQLDVPRAAGAPDDFAVFLRLLVAFLLGLLLGGWLL